MVRLAGGGLRLVGATSPSKSVCSILPLARHLRAGEESTTLTPARTSLLKPAAAQQVQPPHNGQDAYHRQRCEYPEEHSEHLPSLSLAVGYNKVVTHGRRACNNVVAILANDKATSLCSRCSTPVLRDLDLFVFSNEIPIDIKSVKASVVRP